MTSRRVTVATRNDGCASIDAYVFGEWAAHKTLSPGKGWTVTYLPSGRTVAPDKLTEAKAKKLANWLNRSVSRTEMLDWSSLDIEVVAKIKSEIKKAGVS